MSANESVRAMAAQVQEALTSLDGCSHYNAARSCACRSRAKAALKRALETATRAGWRGPDVF